MTRSLRLSLKAGEHIFINGAKLRVDRRVALELLNEAEFLLSQHILAAEEATTPLKLLYFVLQSMLTAPKSADEQKLLYRKTMIALARAVQEDVVLEGLIHVDQLVEQQRLYEALKKLRPLFAVEAQEFEGNAGLVAASRSIIAA